MGEAPAAGARPNYAALLDRDKSARENRCLAEAIYFEARGESEEGQAAVAQVVLNRVASAFIRRQSAASCSRTGNAGMDVNSMCRIVLGPPRPLSGRF